MYKVGNRWIQLTPKITDRSYLEYLHPHMTPKSPYHSPSSIEKVGIYPMEDIEDLEKQFLFPNAIVTGLTRSLTGQQSVYLETLVNLIQPEEIWKIFDSLEDYYLRFSMTVSGIIEIACLYNIITGIIDTIINAFQMHRIYGT